MPKLPSHGPIPEVLENKELNEALGAGVRIQIDC